MSVREAHPTRRARRFRVNVQTDAVRMEVDHVGCVSHKGMELIPLRSLHGRVASSHVVSLLVLKCFLKATRLEPGDQSLDIFRFEDGRAGRHLTRSCVGGNDDIAFQEETPEPAVAPAIRWDTRPPYFSVLLFSS